jgi:2-keto-3-deoxy-L-rhamnonate aldolase RhmA
MRPNRVKKTLREGGVAIGTSAFEFASPGLGRLAAGAGADFLFMDMEHTGWSEETIKMLVATSRAAELVTLVRVPATQYHLIARVLDVGADGIMVPMCESAEQARLLVQSAKYPPVGRRGSAFGIAHDDYSGGDAVPKIREANAETWLCALVETVAGIESVDAIAAVDGIDVIWLGHFDLTNSMGIPTQFTHPDYLRAVDRLLAACRKHGKAPGHLVYNVPDGRAKLEQGFRCLSYSSDMWLFKQALADGIGALRKSPPAG